MTESAASEAVSRGRVRRGDAGVGLVELLVTMSVFGVVLTATMAVLTSLIGVTTTATVRTSTTSDARILMEAVTRSLRVAVVPTGEPSAVTASEVDRVQFYASLDRSAGQDTERATLVTYSYASPCVNETQVPATANPSSDPAVVRQRPYVWTATGVTKCLIRTAAPPRFSYFTSGVISLPDGSTPAPFVPASAAERALVSSVEVVVIVQDVTRGDVRPVVARDRVTFVNVHASSW